jgi:hypothetical protein
MSVTLVPTSLDLLQQKAQQAYNEGQCFFQARAAIGEADLILARDDFAGEPYHRTSKRSTDLRVGRIAQEGWIAVYVRSGATQRQVMRKSYAVASRLAVPLRLEAPFVFDTYTPGRWGTKGLIKKGLQPEYGLSEFLTNDIRVRGLMTETGEPLPLTDRSLKQDDVS